MTDERAPGHKWCVWFSGFSLAVTGLFCSWAGPGVLREGRRRRGRWDLGLWSLPGSPGRTQRLRCLDLRSFWEHRVGGTLFLTSAVFTWGCVEGNTEAQIALDLGNPALRGQIQLGI